MRPDPTVKDHVSLFLYPFFYKEEKKVVREKIQADPLWEAKEPDEPESSYFLPGTRELLFQDNYQCEPCPDVSLIPVKEGKALSLKLIQASLSLFDFRVGILVIGWEIKEEGLQLRDLLNLNESFRFTKPLGEWHNRPSIDGRHIEEYLASLLTGQ